MKTRKELEKRRAELERAPSAAWDELMELRRKLRPREFSNLKPAVKGRQVHIHTTPPHYLEERHGYTKEGHGRHYIAIEKFNNETTLDAAWDRRADAARWAKRAGAKKMTHWYQC